MATRSVVSPGQRRALAILSELRIVADDLYLAGGGVQVVTTTASEIHELSFTTKPGAEVMVNVFDLTSSHEMLHETLIFLMQGGKINGGFTGKLSNPLRVQPTAP